MNLRFREDIFIEDIFLEDIFIEDIFMEDIFTEDNFMEDIFIEVVTKTMNAIVKVEFGKGEERDKKKFEKASAFRVLREEQSQEGRLYSNIQEDQKRTENMVTWKPRKAIVNEGGVVAVLNATEFTEVDESRSFAPVCPILLPSNL